MKELGSDIAVSGRRDFREVTELARKQIKERLETVNGVGSMNLVGGRVRAMTVVLDTERMAGYNLSVEDVRIALARQNLEVPGGRMDQGSRELVLRTLGRLRTEKEFNELIEQGHVYIACPPLYSVKYKGKIQWLLDDEKRLQFLATHADAQGLEFKRFKGLGEMNPKELRDTTFDPARRVLKRVTLEDGMLAGKLVAELMEDKNAERRRTFLAEHARKIKELDV